MPRPLAVVDHRLDHYVFTALHPDTDAPHRPSTSAREAEALAWLARNLRWERRLAQLRAAGPR